MTSRRQFCVVNFHCGKTMSCLRCLFSEINECTDYSPSCHVNAVCQNTVWAHTRVRVKMENNVMVIIRTVSTNTEKKTKRYFFLLTLTLFFQYSVGSKFPSVSSQRNCCK